MDIAKSKQDGLDYKKKFLQSEAELQALFTAVSDIVLIYDKNGYCLSFVSVNTALLFQPIDMQIGKRLDQVLPPETAQKFLNCIQQSLQSRSPAKLEYSLPIDGKDLWFSASVLPTQEDTVMWVARDITQRRQAEAALLFSEEKFSKAFRSSPNPIAITTMQEGRFIEVNDSFLEISGFSCEELIGHTALELGIWVNPGDRTKMVKMLRDRRAVRNQELEFRAKSGEVKTILLSVEAINLGGQECILYVTNDITEHKRSEEAIQKAETKYRNIFENAVEGMFQSTPAGYFLSVNPALARIYGYESPEDLIAKVTDIANQLYVEPSKRDRFMQLIEENDTVLEFEVEIYRQDGEKVWISENARAVRDSEGKLICLEGIVEDITDRRKAEATIRYQASHDLLTDIPNRSLFNERLSNALALARQTQGILAVMFLDLDRFKTINDSLGHTVGDRLLQCVVKRLIECLGEKNTIARWGGDEFTVLLPAINDVEDAIATAQQILDALKPAFKLDGYALHTTCSIGIAIYPFDGDDGDVLVKNADAALYHAKKKGRNNLQLYAKAMNSHAPNLLVLETSLHKALETGEFVVYYQPKVDIDSWQITGMEALVRWQHPELGLVSPQIFIPLAEDSGLIVPLAEWVLRTACAQNKVWYDAGLTHLRMAVNLSARQFLQASLVKMVAQILAETGLEPHLLELEITESLAMQDMDSTKIILRELYNMGVRIAIDDFGTGYSSLSYLRNFPLDCIKVDRSFVDDLTVDPYAKAIMTAVIALGHGLSLDVVVEGVETKEQLEYLRSLQCDEIQGHIFSPPLPAEEATRLLWRQTLEADIRIEMSA
jgi:diguanylate cyclase (GGDEF)-like protein/PAS domain S-box-containing protein